MIFNFVIFSSIFLTLIYYLSVRKNKNFPNGPTGWPIFGNLFQLELPRHLQYIKWGEKYGSIFGLYFGNTPAVVLNNYKDIKELFAGNAVTGKLQTEPVKAHNLGGNRGVVFSEGKVWSEQRRFVVKILREFGFGKKSMETIILNEVLDLIRTLKKETGKPIQTQNRFGVAVLNVLLSVTSGERINQDDRRLNAILQSFTTFVVHRPLTSILAEHFPLVFHLRKMFPILFKNPSLKVRNSILDYVNQSIQHHQDTLQQDSTRDFIDAYLTEIQKTADFHSSFHAFEGELNLRVVMFDLVSAGAETTSNTLVWAFLIMALHPEKQEKLFKEIKNVVGLSRHVSLTDRPQLPYLEATIFEIQRFASLVPLITHNVVADIEFRGYTLKKGVNVVANLYMASRDKSAWGDPDIFRPERFLSSDGETTVRHEAWLPFGTGKRVCLAETLARDELFLFIGNLFQQFQVTTIEGEPKPGLEPFAGVVLIPKPHRLVLHDRCSSSV